MIPAELTPIFPTWNRTYTREAKPTFNPGENGPQIYNDSSSLQLNDSVTINMTSLTAVPWTTIQGNLGMSWDGSSRQARPWKQLLFSAETKENMIERGNLGLCVPHFSHL